ncbi:uncharacterized protein PITG_05330 [Phytophthora infestans T30-4]|uniref:Uncharacterized protein n=1 Tax=Phytophthora infestans (strain T30-4) TaxID=403677 RepID=D0N438_PHYIT|nr:uncharacterized protein PITG_05330 [Phytophthora infestans T30-4]EEY69142.1 hypothetical protein PITG_05330 [Phytophthora infestans T30-4]|eukprot:XP_002998996.1 hypothetical protein PITG_05330 [Phytophthora infestans T30-4]
MSRKPATTTATGDIAGSTMMILLVKIQPVDVYASARVESQRRYSSQPQERRVRTLGMLCCAFRFSCRALNTKNEGRTKKADRLGGLHVVLRRSTSSRTELNAKNYMYEA